MLLPGASPPPRPAAFAILVTEGKINRKKHTHLEKKSQKISKKEISEKSQQFQESQKRNLENLKKKLYTFLE